jgi:hypothetical protein
MQFPVFIKEFIDTEKWTFAKTMPEWPHEYIVRDQVDQDKFEALVCHIREYGTAGRFYNKTLIYFNEDGLMYWTMGAPVQETTIINRCLEEDSYEHRLREGNLP